MPMPAVLRRFLGSRAAAQDRPEMLQRILSWKLNGITGGTLQNPDEALKRYAPSEGIDYYPRVRRQVGAVSGVVDMRADATMALPHTWIPGDPNDVESLDYCEGVRQVWNKVRYRDISMKKMMYAVPEGEQLGELSYGIADVAITAKVTRDTLDIKDAGRVVRTESWVFPDCIYELPRNRFVWDKDFNLRIKPRGNEAEGEVVDDMKVVVARYGSANPYGEAAMKYVVTEAWKLDWIDRRGLEALDKSGYPMAEIHVPELWDEERVKSTLVWAEATYKNFMIVRLGDRFEVTFPDPSARTTFIGADQVSRIKQIEDTIQAAYLGLSFSSNQKGAKASDQVRNEVRFEKTSVDSSVHDEVARQWEEKVYKINRPSMADYKRCRMVTDYKPTADVATRGNIYVQATAVGFPASQQQFGEEFGLRPALHESDRMTPPGQQTKSSPAMSQNIDDPASNDQGSSSIRPGS